MTAFGSEKIGAQKIIKQFFFFQNNFYSLKAHAYYFTVIIYLAPCRAAKLDIFTHFIFTNIGIRCGQSINSLIYVYSIQVPSCFLWMLDHTRDCTSSYYHPSSKKISVLPPVKIFRRLWTNLGMSGETWPHLTKREVLVSSFLESLFACKKLNCSTVPPFNERVIAGTWL